MSRNDPHARIDNVARFAADTAAYLRQVLHILIEATHCTDPNERERLTAEAKAVLELLEDYTNSEHVRRIQQARSEARSRTDEQQRELRDAMKGGIQ